MEYDVEDINHASFALVFAVLAKCVMQLTAVSLSSPRGIHWNAGGWVQATLPSLIPKDESQDCTPLPSLAVLEAFESSHRLSWSLTPSRTPQHSNCASCLSALCEARWK